jgi:hypothetical protein
MRYGRSVGKFNLNLRPELRVASHCDGRLEQHHMDERKELARTQTPFRTAVWESRRVPVFPNKLN